MESPVEKTFSLTSTTTAASNSRPIATSSTTIAKRLSGNNSSSPLSSSSSSKKNAQNVKIKVEPGEKVDFSALATMSTIPSEPTLSKGSAAVKGSTMSTQPPAVAEVLAGRPPEFMTESKVELPTGDPSRVLGLEPSETTPILTYTMNVNGLKQATAPKTSSYMLRSTASFTNSNLVGHQDDSEGLLDGVPDDDSISSLSLGLVGRFKSQNVRVAQNRTYSYLSQFGMEVYDKYKEMLGLPVRERRSELVTWSLMLNFIIPVTLVLVIPLLILLVFALLLAIPLACIAPIIYATYNAIQATLQSQSSTTSQIRNTETASPESGHKEPCVTATTTTTSNVQKTSPKSVKIIDENASLMLQTNQLDMAPCDLLAAENSTMFLKDKKHHKSKSANVIFTPTLGAGLLKMSRNDRFAICAALIGSTMASAIVLIPFCLITPLSLIAATPLLLTIPLVLLAGLPCAVIPFAVAYFYSIKFKPSSSSPASNHRRHDKNV